MSYLDIIMGRYEEISNYALSLIAKRIKSIGRLSAYDQQALKNLSDITGDMQKITKKLAELTKLNISDIEKLYGETITEEGETYKPLYDLKNKKYVPYSQNKKAQRLTNHWVKQTKKTLINLSATKALRVNKYNLKGDVIGSMPFKGAFQEAIDTAVTAVTTGAVDFNLAMRDTIKKLGGSGLKVNYGTDKNGRPVNRSLASMARQNILYGTREAIKAYNDELGEELGCDGIEISFSSTCRPSHQFMEGKQYAIGGAKIVDGKRYEDAAPALKALSDYGCNHRDFKIILGVSQPAHTREEIVKRHAEENELIEYNGKTKTRYEWQQAQRRLESGTRRERNIREMAKESGDTVLVKRCNENISRRKAAYDDLCANVGLENRWNRSAHISAKTVDKVGKSGIIGLRKGQTIGSPIEQRNTSKGNPNAILQIGRPLNNRQQKLLNSLPNYDSRITVHKKSVNMKDLSALTAHTGDEFALFTKGKERLVIRGNKGRVNIDVSEAKQLSKQGYKWSGHTHPGTDRNCLIHSPGDEFILNAFGQRTSVIYNSKGQFELFKGDY